MRAAAELFVGPLARAGARASRWAAALLLPAAAVAAAAPSAGRYDGELCVALAVAAPSCGRAELELAGDGAASVRVSDIVYRLQLGSSQVEVVLMHGSMQIDEFFANYEWAGNTLQFADKEKRARYEVRFTEARPAQ